MPAERKVTENKRVRESNKAPFRGCKLNSSVTKGFLESRSVKERDRVTATEHPPPSSILFRVKVSKPPLFRVK